MPAGVHANSKHSYAFAYTCTQDHIYKHIHLHMYFHVYI